MVWPPDPDSGEAVLRESLRLPDSLAQSPSDAKQWNAAVDAALADAGARSALAAADDADDTDAERWESKGALGDTACGYRLVNRDAALVVVAGVGLEWARGLSTLL